MTPQRYRKKPVVIEAWQVSYHPTIDWLEEDLASWCGGHVVYGPTGDVVGIEIATLEGTMRADVGVWIIRGVKGEFYPCKPDIFDATYEPEEVTP